MIRLLTSLRLLVSRVFAEKYGNNVTVFCSESKIILFLFKYVQRDSHFVKSASFNGSGLESSGHNTYDLERSALATSLSKDEGAAAVAYVSLAFLTYEVPR